MKNIIMVVLSFMVGVAACTSVYAGSSTTSCTDPVTREDGTPFSAATDLDHYEWWIDGVYMSGQDTTSCSPFTLIAPGPDGDKKVQAVTVDKQGRKSQLSPIKTKPFTTANPLPPVIN